MSTRSRHRSVPRSPARDKRPESGKDHRLRSPSPRPVYLRRSGLNHSTPRVKKTRGSPLPQRAARCSGDQTRPPTATVAGSTWPRRPVEHRTIHAQWRTGNDRGQRVKKIVIGTHGFLGSHAPGTSYARCPASLSQEAHRAVPVDERSCGCRVPRLAWGSELGFVAVADPPRGTGSVPGFPGSVHAGVDGHACSSVTPRWRTGISVERDADDRAAHPFLRPFLDQ